MSHAIQAMVMINVDHYQGHWVPVSWIAARMALPMATVLAECVRQVENGQIKHLEIDGEPHFGIYVDASSPAMVERVVLRSAA